MEESPSTRLRRTKSSKPADEKRNPDDLIHEIKMANIVCGANSRKQRCTTIVGRSAMKAGGRFLYWWRHPGIRLLAPVYILLSDILVHAADPVDHSEIEYRMRGVGHVYNLMNPFNGQPLHPLGHALKVVLTLTCLGVGIMIPPWLRKVGFEENRVGRWLMKGPLGLIFPIILGFLLMGVAAAAWNDVLERLDFPRPSPYDYQQSTTAYITDGLDISWRTSANVIDTFVFVLDWLTLYLVIDIMLQDGTQYRKESRFWFRGKQYDVRDMWTRTWNGRFRIAVTWVIFILSFVWGVNFVWYTTRKWQIKKENEIPTGMPLGPVQLWEQFVNFNQYERALIYATQFFADIMVVQQDWEFPTFENQVRVALLGTNIAFEGRIGNYIMMFIVAAIDVKALAFALFYSPVDVAQYVDPQGWVWAFTNQTLLREVKYGDWPKYTELSKREDQGCFRKLSREELQALSEECLDLKSALDTNSSLESVEEVDLPGRFMAAGINACCDVRIRAKFIVGKAADVWWRNVIFILEYIFPLPAALALTVVLFFTISRSRYELCRRTVLSMTLAKEFELQKVKAKPGLVGGVEVAGDFLELRAEALRNLFEFDPRGGRRRSLTPTFAQTFANALGNLSPAQALGEEELLDLDLEENDDHESDLSSDEQGARYQMHLTRPRRGAPLLLVSSHGVFSIHAGLNATVADLLQYMETHRMHKGVNTKNIRLRTSDRPLSSVNPGKLLGHLMPIWADGTSVVPLYIHTTLRLNEDKRGDASSIFGLCAAFVLGVVAMAGRLGLCVLTVFSPSSTCAERMQELSTGVCEAFKLFAHGGGRIDPELAGTMATTTDFGESFVESQSLGKFRLRDPIERSTFIIAEEGTSSGTPQQWRSFPKKAQSQPNFGGVSFGADRVQSREQPTLAQTKAASSKNLSPMVAQPSALSGSRGHGGAKVGHVRTLQLSDTVEEVEMEWGDASQELQKLRAEDMTALMSEGRQLRTSRRAVSSDFEHGEQNFSFEGTQETISPMAATATTKTSRTARTAGNRVGRRDSNEGTGMLPSKSFNEDRL